jgi:chemotaxis protein methyltransferase CheR
MPVDRAELDFVCQLVKQQSGIVLDSSKDYLVDARLKPLAKELGFDGIDALVQSLRLKTSPELATRVVEAMTTNETTFFRDVHPFEALRTQILPSLLSSRSSKKTLAIWCAAASTGQEPYSIAMLLEEHFPQLRDWRVSILATDISQNVLGKARAGKYHQLEVNRGLPARFLTKYFEQGGMHWTLKESVRRRVEFRYLNLTSPWPAMPTMDIIFIRNVLIYFDQDTRREILRRARQRLSSDGYLFVGSTETTAHNDTSFTRAPFDRAGCYQPART